MPVCHKWHCHKLVALTPPTVAGPKLDQEEEEKALLGPMIHADILLLVDWSGKLVNTDQDFCRPMKPQL